jgi:translation elongation factor EF-1beta
MDLFGDDDDEEAEKAKAERAKQMEAKKNAGKPKVIAKSSIALDIKVWDDETDLKDIEQTVRAIEKDGLLWGSSQLIPVAFGMNKLRIVCVVEDEKVSVDWLTDKIEELELVQSTDIAAFQKI